jgi:hypothetical protein
MSNCADPARLSADNRLRETAAILAADVLRQRQRAASPSETGRDNLVESSPDGLEVPAKTRLSVRAGQRYRGSCKKPKHDLECGERTGGAATNVRGRPSIAVR